MDAVVAAVRCRPVTKVEELNGQKHGIEILPHSKQVILKQYFSYRDALIV